MPPKRSFPKKSVLLPVYGEAHGQVPAAGAAASFGSGYQHLPQLVGKKSGLKSFDPETKTAAAASELDQKAHLSIHAPAGCTFHVCPFFPFVVENCLAVAVHTAKALMGSSCCIEISGALRRSHMKYSNGHVPGVNIRLTPVSDSTGPGQGLCVASAQGHPSLRRCAAENWLVLTGDGHPVHLAAEAQLAQLPGSTLLLQRPAERVYVLRNPEEQLSRLVVQMASDRGTQLLAAPASGGAVAVMAACKSSSEMLIPHEVLSEIEFRFSVVFVPERAANNILASKATDTILRRLVAFGVRDCLRKDSWQSAEYPYRLFQSQSMSSAEILQRPSLRVPCVDVECDQASSSSSQILADVRFSPAVRLVQPLAPFLVRSARSPELAGSFCLQGNEATQRPLIHVLPRLTAAQVTHIWHGPLPKEQLPRELQEVSSFRDYWRMIHGHCLNESTLAAFARVQFLGGDHSHERGLVLTYPVSCLWRTFWVCQPALSKQHGLAIVKQVLQTLDKNAIIGAWQVQYNGFDQTGPISVPPALALNRSSIQDAAKKIKPVESPVASDPAPVRKSGHTGKRRLILPLVHTSGSSSAGLTPALPSKRQCVR
ncbi:unnamed protein product [Symbiodinium natans]|uniref:Uncharacterized protein n=1 Tax=Symbiodinium natans TaxID=878477 RepID=A0A812K450_9DINO|nr:unnamed protein product [Symbiodinium natans]